MQIYFVISKFSVRFYFPEGASPNHAGVTTRSVASRKVALGDQYTKGSETAKVGTDEQKRHKRHREKGEYAHQCEARSWQTNANTPKRWFSVCRCRSDWRKENALTKGGLLQLRVSIAKKSAEVIVQCSNEPTEEWRKGWRSHKQRKDWTQLGFQLGQESSDSPPKRKQDSKM